MKASGVDPVEDVSSNCLCQKALIRRHTLAASLLSGSCNFNHTGMVLM
jgi:hypothetical protein